MGAVQQYIDLYRSQKNLINSHSSAVMNGLREEAVALLESRGLPSLKDEEHRRTDIESVYSPDYGLNLGRIDIEINPYEVFRCDVPLFTNGFSRYHLNSLTAFWWAAFVTCPCNTPIWYRVITERSPI